MSIKCRKCGGNHLTIKCGINLEQNKIQSSEKSIVSKSAPTKGSGFTQNNYSRTFDRSKKQYKVKINNLPNDITFSELSNMLKDWGHINKINIKNFSESSYAIIEFQYEDEQIYFIEALNSTPFQYQIITVEKIFET
jgi:RNA recognition motif-containing protein